MTSEDDFKFQFVGVDISSRHLRYGLVNENGGLKHFQREAYNLTDSHDEDARDIANRIKNAIADVAGKGAGPISGIGIGFPGLVNHVENRLVHFPRVPALTAIDLGQEIHKSFGVPVFFENNTNAATAAELRTGVMQGVSDGLFLRIGNRIGAGLVLDGKLRRGKSGYAGEIGHVNIDPEGIDCHCGSRGCLETIASAPNIVRRTRARLDRDSTSSLSHFEKLGREFTYHDIIQAAEDGDDLAQLMIRRTGHFIGMAVADTINLLNLSQVVIAGTMAARLLLIPAIQEETRKRAIAEAFADCEIVPARLGSEAGVVGAALLAHIELQKRH